LEQHKECLPVLLCLLFYLSKKHLLELNQRRLQAQEPEFKNPRNAAAGTLRMLDSNEVRRRKLDLFVYILTEGPVKERHSENLELMRDLLLPVNPETQSCNNIGSGASQ